MNARRTTTDIALVAVFAALVAVCSIVPGIPVGPAPITLQSLAVAVTALVLGPGLGTAAVALWLVVGFAGLPVFNGGNHGIGMLSRPTAGYLLGFLVAAFVMGLLARIVVRRYRATAVRGVLLALVAGAVGLFIEHALGIAGMMRNAHLPFARALTVDLAFVPLDLVKAVVAALIAVAVHSAFPTLLAAPTGARDLAAEPEVAGSL